METKIVTKDSFQELKLDLQKDVDNLVRMSTEKVTKASAKKAPAKFATEAITGLRTRLSLAEAESLHKVLKELQQKKKKEELELEKQRKLEEAKAEEEKKKELLPENELSDEAFFADLMT
mmetsp:Transcript_27291/g.62851  ORF Transcript_27291/g.62851 Transcript_27291/m.62851 type:complete len:120 (-) Transcript_27291:68-427(-)